MRIDVFNTRFSLHHAREGLLDGATCVVIDVLRASSTITKAIYEGAMEIHIAESPEEAFELKEKLGDDVLLCGERNGLIIPGFDIGNSPLDYNKGIVGGRRIIFASTNGSKTIRACEKAYEILIGGFVNLSAVVNELVHAESVVLACSGKLGRFSIEDAVCAGMIIDRLSSKNTRINLLSDTAWNAFWLLERYLSNPEEVLEKTEHAVYLARELGLAEDVAFCTAIDKFDLVPRYENGVITP